MKPNNSVMKTKAQKKRERNSEKYKQFTGNKQEGQGFANRRKLRMMHEYNKIKRKEQGEIQKYSEKTAKIYETEMKEEMKEKSDTAKPKKKVKVSRFHTAELESKKKAEEQDAKTKEMEEQQKQKEEAMSKYKKNKKAQHKKLAVKNYKGQPNMANQIELLLEKIEKQVKS